MSQLSISEPSIRRIFFKDPLNSLVTQEFAPKFVCLSLKLVKLLLQLYIGKEANHWIQHFGQIEYQPFSWTQGLQHYPFDHFLLLIHIQVEGFADIWCCQSRCIQQSHLNFIEGLFHLWHPIEESLPPSWPHT